jgi:hypothetical protein
MPLGESISFADVTQLIKDYANFFYDTEPNVTEHQKNIEACKTVEELEALKDVIRMSDSVSLFNLWNEQKIKLAK